MPASNAPSSQSPVEFFFDFSSPYAYLAAHQIEPLAARYGRRVAWRPMLLGVIFKVSGSRPLTEQYAPKARYSMLDFQRSARLAGLPFRQPDPFPIATQNAGRAVLWVESAAPERTGDFVRAAGRAYFVDNAPINEPAVLKDLAGRLGLDGAALEAAIAQPEIKDALKAVCEEAVARGVFGAPFMFLDGEPFWGQDRLAQLEAALRERSAAPAAAHP